MFEKLGIEGCPPSRATYKANPLIVLDHAWLASTMFAVGSSVASLIVAASNDNERKGSKGVGFAAVWSAFMVLALCWFLYKTLKEWRTASSVGFSIGATLTISQMFLCMFAIFVAMAKEAGITADTGTLESDSVTMAIFSFSLFALYSLFGVLLIKYRSHVILESVDDGADGHLNRQEAHENSEASRGLNQPANDDDGEYEDQDLGADVEQTGSVPTTI